MRISDLKLWLPVGPLLYDLRGEAGWLVITAVDFIRHQIPNISIANLQREMNGRRSLSDWLLVAGVHPAW